MSMTVRLALFVAGIALAGTAQAQEVGPPATIPNCAEVCKHIMALALETVPEGEREAARAAGAEVLKECIPGCETDLDSEARTCFMKARSMADGDACDKALTERKRKLEPDDPKSRPKEQR